MTYFLIYKITNTINNKIYIGSHKTKNINDSYMGSGKYLKSAIAKHGPENFFKEILFMFDNPIEMYAKEAELVNEDFLSEANTYNLKVGGTGGWDYVNSRGLQGFKNIELAKAGRELANDVIKQKYTPEQIHQWQLKAIATSVAYMKLTGTGLYNPTISEKGRTAARSPEAIAKKKATFAKINHQVGENNSQYGSRWVTHPILGNKMIRPDDLNQYLSLGYVLGRANAFALKSK